ncbi:MAG: queuosine precursor transporter [Alphaproteobacteria bacterium]|nr:queuosine precursor transporter [Alphaproteobacteria bacterium]
MEHKTYRFLPLITGIFTATLLVSHTIGSKIMVFGPLTFSVALIIFPLSYLANDILTEVYGYKTSRKVIWTGFAASLLMVLCYQAALAIPGAPFWNDQSAFETVLGGTPRLVAASMTAYFMGEFCNSYVLAKMKVKMKGKIVGFRFVASTVVGEFIDSITFFPLAFYGVISNNVLISAILSGWVFKVIWEIVALPVTLPFVRYLKRAEHEDYYDKNTNFNPFRF